MDKHGDDTAPTQEQLDSPERFTIPWITLSGGEASPEQCLRFRIWFNGPDGYAFKDYAAFREAREVARARMVHDMSFQRLVGVVWDNAYRDFREVAINDNDPKWL